MNVLLINPRENIVRDREMYPSGALILMGTMLKQRGHNISLVHMTADDMGEDELRNHIAEFKPEVAGISMNTYQTRSARHITSLIKSTCKDILVVVGGPHPSALRCEIFESFPGVDVVVCGEGEWTFIDIVEGADLKHLAGICYERRENAPRDMVADLDYVPLPDLDLVTNLGNFSGTPPVGASPSFFISAGRGCPFRCKFCSKSVFGTSCRFRKPEDIVNEIDWLRTKYGMKEIYFVNDLLNLHRDWTEAVFNGIIERGLSKSVTFKAQFRANHNLVDAGLLTLAKEAGFWHLFYGVETGSQELLDGIGKGLTVEEIERAFRLTREAGLSASANFIVGYIGETWKTVFQSWRLLAKLKPLFFGFTLAQPLPGTAMREMAMAKGHLLETSYDAFDWVGPLCRTDAMGRRQLVLAWYLSGIAGTLLGLWHANSRKDTAKDIARKLRMISLNWQRLVRR